MFKSDIELAAGKISGMGLRKCLREIFNLHSTGILSPQYHFVDNRPFLKEGLVRDFANEVVFKVTNDNSTKLKMAENVLLRWAGIS